MICYDLEPIYPILFGKPIYSVIFSAAILALGTQYITSFAGWNLVILVSLQDFWEFMATF